MRSVFQAWISTCRFGFEAQQVVGIRLLRSTRCDAAASAEAPDGFAVRVVQAVADVDGEQPELVEAGAVQRGQHRIGLTYGAAVACG